MIWHAAAVIGVGAAAADTHGACRCTSTPDLRKFGWMGVARVSTATCFAMLAFAAIDHAAAEIQMSGRFDVLTAEFTYADAQRLFAQR